MKTKNRKSKPATSANRKGSAELRSKDLLAEPRCGFCAADGSPCKNKPTQKLVRLDHRFGNYICKRHALGYINDGQHRLERLG